MFGKKKSDSKNIKSPAKAVSNEHGIVFFSRIAPFAIDVYVEDGKICTQVIPSLLEEMSEDVKTFIKAQNDMKQFKKHAKIVAILDILLITISIFLLKSFSAAYASVYFSLLLSFTLSELVITFHKFDFKHGLYSTQVARFHGAEHMAINSYIKLGRVPTFEEVKKASRFSKGCGMSGQLMRLGTWFCVFITIFFADINIYVHLSFLALTIVMIIFILTGTNLIQLQALVTAKPTKLEIDCALKGIQELDKMDERIKADIERNPNIISIPCMSSSLEELISYIGKKFEIPIENMIHVEIDESFENSEED